MLVLLLNPKMLNTMIIFLSFIAIVQLKKVSFRVKRAPIINGLPIKISKAPYFASIVEKDKDFQKWSPVCGATIITNMWLLTAAHCIQPPINDLKIRTGIDKYFLPTNKEDDFHLHDICDAVPHPDFMPINRVNFNDIGLIKLKTPIDFVPGLQTSIKLPNSSFDLKAGSYLTVLGFGLNTNEEAGNIAPLSETMLYGIVKVINKEECEEIYKNWIIKRTNHHFCATSKKYEVAKGDSGGPAVANSKLIGIISSGGQGKDQYPGLFIDVRKYIDWIRDFVEPELAEPSSQCCTVL